MRPLSRLTCLRGSCLQQQGVDGGPLPTATMSSRTSCTSADSFTYSTDLPTNTTDVPAVYFEKETEDIVDGLKQGHPNILVTVRVRPVHPRELQNGSKDIIRVLNSKVLLLLDPGSYSHGDVLRVKRTREKRFTFDYVFDASKDQQSVYANTTEFLVDGVLQGFNATAFAYGATGAGKTYTMIGSYEKPGVMVRTLYDLFTRVEHQSADKEYTVRCSFLEIYNEAVRDLLDTRNEHCEVREDPSRGMAISNICEVDVKTADEILELLQRGNKKRIQEPTDANQSSSRSHAVLQVTVTQKSRTPGTTAEVAVGKLSMVDLAGSERASQNNNRGIRMVEGASINRSLLALGNVINALCDKSKSAKNTFIPYRDSKLTRLLKDSLGGSCRTVMIANISPAHTQFEDTNNTLKYASRAKSIKTFSKRNILGVNCHLEKYTHVIEQLQAEVGTLRAMLASGTEATILQDTAVTASGTRVTGIVRTLQERQQLRQALARLDEQLHQLGHHSPVHLDWALTGVSPQARSLRKAKENMVTRLQTNAAEYEELQQALLLAPDSPALLHTLLKNMKTLLEQNYQLQQTNEQLNETLMQNGQSQRNTSSESVLRRRLRQTADFPAEKFHRKASNFLPSDSPERANYHDGALCGEQTQNGRQQRPSPCSEESTSAAPVIVLRSRQRSSASGLTSPGTHNSAEPASSGPATTQHSCSVVERETEHCSVPRIALADSMPSLGHSDSSVSQSCEFTRSVNKVHKADLQDRKQITSHEVRCSSPIIAYRKGQSPTTSSMHASHVCSPGRWSSGSSPLQDCSFYTPRSQPLALAAWTASCSHSFSSAIPNEASWSTETSAAVGSARSGSPRCSTANLSPSQPSSPGRQSRISVADTPVHTLENRAVNPPREGYAYRSLHRYVKTSDLRNHNTADLQLKRPAAPVQYSQCLPGCSPAMLADHDCESMSESHYHQKETSQLKRNPPEKASETHFSLQRMPSRNFSEEADVPDELGTDNLDKIVEAATPLLAPTVFDVDTACSVSLTPQKGIFDVNKRAGPSGSTEVTTGEHTLTGQPVEVDGINSSRLSPKRHAATLAKGPAAHQHTSGNGVRRCNCHLLAGEVQTSSDENSYSTYVGASEFGNKTRTHFGFRCADASDTRGA